MPVQPMSYAQIAADLDERITAGDYPPGARLPSYAELAKLYTVSVATAARAVMVLRARGTVVGVPGRGVYVADDVFGP